MPHGPASGGRGGRRRPCVEPHVGSGTPDLHPHRLKPDGIGPTALVLSIPATRPVRADPLFQVHVAEQRTPHLVLAAHPDLTPSPSIRESRSELGREGEFQQPARLNDLSCRCRYLRQPPLAMCRDAFHLGFCRSWSDAALNWAGRAGSVSSWKVVRCLRVVLGSRWHPWRHGDTENTGLRHG